VSVCISIASPHSIDIQQMMPPAPYAANHIADVAVQRSEEVIGKSHSELGLQKLRYWYLWRPCTRTLLQKV